MVTTLRVDCSHHVCQSLRANILLHKVDLVTFFEAVYDPGQLLNFAEFLESFDNPLKSYSPALISLQNVVLYRRKAKALICCLVHDKFGIAKWRVRKVFDFLVLEQPAVEILVAVDLLDGSSHFVKVLEIDSNALAILSVDHSNCRHGLARLTLLI